MNASQAIDHTVNAFFSIFDNREGRIADFSSLDKLFVKDAIITRLEGNELELMSLDEFILPRKKILTDGSLINFYEWINESRVLINQQIATVICSYQKSGELNGKPYTGCGMKHIQLAQLGQKWKIAAIIWQDTV